MLCNARGRYPCSVTSSASLSSDSVQPSRCSARRASDLNGPWRSRTWSSRRSPRTRAAPQSPHRPGRRAPTRSEGKTRRDVDLAKRPRQLEGVAVGRLHFDQVGPADARDEVDTRDAEPSRAPPLSELGSACEELEYARTRGRKQPCQLQRKPIRRHAAILCRGGSGAQLLRATSGSAASRSRYRFPCEAIASPPPLRLGGSTPTRSQRGARLRCNRGLRSRAFGIAQLAPGVHCDSEGTCGREWPTSRRPPAHHSRALALRPPAWAQV